MVRILIANQKGGVGKSLIADELAFSFTRSGIPISFYDLDRQGGTLHRTARRDDAQAAVIDTPGAFQQSLKDWIAEADVVVIPTRTTSRDIATLQRMQRAVRDARKTVVYVLNGWNRWRASSDFLAWFRASSGEAPIYKLPQSEQFVQAGASGISVVEYARRGPAARATLKLCGGIRELSGFPVEE